MTKQLVASQQKELTKHTHRIIRNGPKIHESNEQCLADLHRRILVNILEIGNSDAFKKKVGKHFEMFAIQRTPWDRDIKYIFPNEHLHVLIKRRGVLDAHVFKIAYSTLTTDGYYVVAHIDGHHKGAFRYQIEPDCKVVGCVPFAHFDLSSRWPMEFNLEAPVSFKPNDYIWNDILDRVVDWIVVGRDRVRRGLSYE